MGQSVAEAQPHLPVERHALPVVLPEHEMQAPPEMPHSGAVSPVTHVPVVVSQQPPLHGWVEEHAVVQMLVVVSHASSEGQSEAKLQPHVPLERHASPVLRPTHEVHDPERPHAGRVSPGAHTPELQQPPLQGSPEEHVVPHIPVDVSQASSVGQSVAIAQPQSPVDRQALPDEPPRQKPQVPPSIPQARGDVPAAHMPELQQPPLHGWLPEHVLVHTPLLVSHASSAGQSVAMAQPHVPLERHAVPELPPAHEVQVPPAAPHAVCAVPGAHVPALQQPPLHVWVDVHAVVHLWVAVSHASSVGQSVGTAQPPPVSASPAPVSVGPVSCPESVVPSG